MPTVSRGSSDVKKLKKRVREDCFADISILVDKNLFNEAKNKKCIFRDVLEKGTFKISMVQQPISNTATFIRHRPPWMDVAEEVNGNRVLNGVQGGVSTAATAATLLTTNVSNTRTVATSFCNSSSSNGSSSSSSSSSCSSNSIGNNCINNSSCSNSSSHNLEDVVPTVSVQSVYRERITRHLRVKLCDPDKTRVEERHIVVFMSAYNFARSIYRDKGVTNIQNKIESKFHGKTVYFILESLDKYIAKKISRETKKIRDAVNGIAPTPSPKTNAVTKGGRNSSRGAGSVEEDCVFAAVDRDMIERSLIHMEMFGYHIRTSKNAEESAALLLQVAEGLAFVPEKFRMMDSFDAFDASQVKRTSVTLTEAWTNQLTQIPGVSSERACSIVAKYPTLQSLLSAYGSMNLCNEKERAAAQLLVAGITYGSKNRKLGNEISKRIFQVFTAENWKRAVV